MLDEKSKVESPEPKPHWNKGRKHTQEQRERTSAALRGKKQSAETIAKRSASMRGKKHRKRTPEENEANRQRRLAQSNKAHPSAMAKKLWADLRADPIRYEAYIEKLRNRPRVSKPRPELRGVPRSQEVRQKISKAQIGKHVPDETRRKLAAAQTGKVMSEEAKAKIAAFNLGRKHPNGNYRRGVDHHNFGKPPPMGTSQAKGSYCLKGHWVRSSWEKIVADVLFSSGIEYEYEGQLFDLRDNIRYRPDFYIPAINLWVEVKGYMPPRDEEKHRRFTALGHRLFVIQKKEFQLFQQIGIINIPQLEQLAS
jgi:hypothetical protein